MRVVFIQKKKYMRIIPSFQRLSTVFLAVLLTLIHPNFTCGKISNKIPTFLKIRGNLEFASSFSSWV